MANNGKNKARLVKLRYLIYTGIILTCISVFAQKQTTIFLEHSETLSFDKEQLADVQVLRGNVIFRQEQTLMYCDSAYFYEGSNNMDAFGNVRMVQGDTLFVYADVMYYDGNTKLARLRGNVRMINRETTLETDSFNFDRTQNVGYYYTGGKLYDSQNVLTSIWGEYSPATKIAIFRDDVRLLNDRFSLATNDLTYNTNNKVAYLMGPSVILYEEETTIYSEYGWYNTETEEAELLMNSFVEHIDGKKLIGDTIFYNKKIGEGTAHSNVQLIDAEQQMTIYGNYGYFREADSYGLMLDSAMAVEHSSIDTLYLHADTLLTYIDTLSIAAKDSTLTDSTCHILKGLHNVRFFREDLQGKCDSLLYSTRDSIVNMYENPVLWSDSMQLSGNFMQIFQRNNSPEMLWVQDWAFVVLQQDTARFNQLAGKSLKAYFTDKKLTHVEVEGNAETVYYPVDEADGELMGIINRAASSNITIWVNNGKLDRIKMFPSPAGTMYPEAQIPSDQIHLTNFHWLEHIRPKNRQDIFTSLPAEENVTPVKKRRRR